MTGKRATKIILSIMLVLIVTILSTAAVLRAENAAKPMMSHDFTDVPVVGQEFMEPYIDTFYHMGIAEGCSLSPLMYCPNNNVTRGSIAVFMGRALGYVDMTTDGLNARAYFKQTGTTTTQHGVIGSSPNGIGVWGTSASSYGVYATSGSGTPLLATSTVQSTSDTIYDLTLGGTNGEMFGTALNLYSNTGVVIDLDNDNNSSTDTFTIRSGSNATQFRVDEQGNVTSGPLSVITSGIGVTANSSNGNGVVASSDNAHAVLAMSTNGIGVFATSQNSYGLYAESVAGSAISASAAANSNADTIFDLQLDGALGEIGGALLHLFSDDDFIIDLDNNNNGNDVFSIRNSSNNVVFQVTEAGAMVATGSKSAIVDTVSYGTRAMYAVEATEVLFEEVGSAELIDGEAIIEIDPMFAETVNLDEPYQVFLTPVGSATLLYVAEQTATSFTVRADGGESLQFHYRIVAKRLGYEDVRMEEVNP